MSFLIESGDMRFVEIRIILACILSVIVSALLPPFGWMFLALHGQVPGALILCGSVLISGIWIYRYVASSPQEQGMVRRAMLVYLMAYLGLVLAMPWVVDILDITTEPRNIWYRFNPTSDIDVPFIIQHYWRVVLVACGSGVLHGLPQAGVFSVCCFLFLGRMVEKGSATSV